MTRKPIVDGYYLARGDDGVTRIFTPDGIELDANPWNDLSIHAAVMRHQAAQRKAKRKCLSCGKMFESSHIGNRMCRKCKEPSEVGRRGKRRSVA